MIGYVLVNAKALIAIRDSLVDEDYDQAYHILRMQADPDCHVCLTQGDHWAQWEAIAEHAPAQVEKVLIRDPVGTGSKT
jgi:hypothetical protein